MSNGAHALIVALGEDPSPTLAEKLGLRGPVVTEPIQVWRVGRPLGEVAGALAGAVLNGVALGAALISEELLPENAWMAFEWRGSLVVDRQLGKDVGADLGTGWHEVDRCNHQAVRVFKPGPPPFDAPAAPNRVESADEFRSALAGDRPVAVEVSPEALLAAPREWFDDLADPRLGGSIALITLSGARTAEQPFLLRNPAALGLELTDSPTQAARACAGGLVDIRGWGFSWGSLSIGDLPTEADPSLLDEALGMRRASIASYGVLLEIEARVDPEIELEDGTVLEQEALTGVQTLAVAERRSVTVDVGELRPLVASAWCLNQTLAPPRGEPVRPTPLKLAQRNTSQGDVWQERDRYRVR